MQCRLEEGVLRWIFFFLRFPALIDNSSPSWRIGGFIFYAKAGLSELFKVTLSNTWTLISQLLFTNVLLPRVLVLLTAAVGGTWPWWRETAWHGEYYTILKQKHAVEARSCIKADCIELSCCMCHSLQSCVFQNWCRLVTNFSQKMKR